MSSNFVFPLLRELLTESKLKQHLSSLHHLDLFHESCVDSDQLPTSTIHSKFECQICKQIFFQIDQAIGHQHSEDEKKNLRRKVSQLLLNCLFTFCDRILIKIFLYPMKR